MNSDHETRDTRHALIRSILLEAFKLLTLKVRDAARTMSLAVFAIVKEW